MKNFLPEQFQFSHDFSLYLHDRLAHLIIYGEKNAFFKTQFKFKNEQEAKEFESCKAGNVLDYLEKKEKGDIVGEILLKTIFPAMLSDFCHFIYEVLSCSKKAKLAVAYALLRKPLKENLLYLEWLLSNPDGFLNTFYNQESKELSFGYIGSNPDNLKKVIKGAVDRTVLANMFDHEYLYDIRFNKACPYGFDSLWNQAIHLITTKPPIETEKQNFNFIFSGDEERISQWEQLYGLLPYLLFYTVEICEVLITIIRKEPMPDYAPTSFHRGLGFILWGAERNKVLGNSERKNRGLEYLFLDCPRCGNPIPPDVERVRRLFYYEKIKCPNCGKRLLCESFVKLSNRKTGG